MKKIKIVLGLISLIYSVNQCDAFGSNLRQTAARLFAIPVAAIAVPTGLGWATYAHKIHKNEQIADQLPRQLVANEPHLASVKKVKTQIAALQQSGILAKSPEMNQHVKPLMQAAHSLHQAYYPDNSYFPWNLGRDQQAIQERTQVLNKHINDLRFYTNMRYSQLQDVKKPLKKAALTSGLIAAFLLKALV